eukprot:gene54167-72393_t
MRLVTYNVHRCVGIDRRLDVERIAGVIAELEPDIVCLQELDVGRARTGGVDQARAILPRDIDEPTVRQLEVDDAAPILTYAVSAPNMSDEALSWFVDDTVKRALQGQPGIGRVDRYGGSDREVRVELDPNRLDALGVTAADISSQLQGTNVDLGSGRGQVAGAEQSIRTLGDNRDVASLSNTTI